jgi:dolichyl-phosphate beta-glucosyltransferase
MKTTLVIPCYNEAQRLKPLLFLAYDKYQFVFVNDGSTDITRQILEKLRSPNIHVLNLDRNLGKSEAVRLGMIEAQKRFQQSEWIGYWDADLATPFDQVDYMLKFLLINDQEYHAIFASRVMRLGTNINRSFKRHVLGRLFITYASCVLGINAYDSQCGAKLFRASVVSDIFEKPFISKWLFDMEIIKRMSQMRLNILECPIQKWQEVDGSKVKPFRDGTNALFEVLKIKKLYGK